MDQESLSPPQILIVDQSRVVRWTASKALGQDFVVHEADDGKSAWELLQRNADIALVFTSLPLPLMDGGQLLRAIRGADEPRLNHLPVVVILRHEDDGEIREQLHALGATDFIAKPFDTLTLKSRATAYAGLKRRLRSLEEKSERDPLTDLPNERAFLLQGDKQLALALRHRTDLTVVLLEAEGLAAMPRKKHRGVGERLLREAAGRIAAGLRTEDMAARIAPSRFALLLPLTNRAGARQAVTRICRVLNDDLARPGDLPPVRFRAGITSLDGQDGLDFARLLAQAEQALGCALAAPEAAEVVDHRAEFHARTRHVEPGTAPTDARLPIRLGGMGLDAILGEIRHGQGARLGDALLAAALRFVWPLLVHADSRLNLGLELALKDAEKRLSELSTQPTTETACGENHRG